MKGRFLLLKKENIWLAGLALLLLAAAITNFALKNKAEPTEGDIGDEPGEIVLVNGEDETEGEEDETVSETEGEEAVSETEGDSDSYFVEYRFNRDDTRNQEITLLTTIKDDEEASEAAREEARDKIAAIADTMEMELLVESLLKAKDFTEAAAIINGDSINVVVEKAEITDQDAAIILDIVMSETGISPQNVKITPKTK